MPGPLKPTKIKVQPANSPPSQPHVVTEADKEAIGYKEAIRFLHEQRNTTLVRVFQGSQLKIRLDSTQALINLLEKACKFLKEKAKEPDHGNRNSAKVAPAPETASNSLFKKVSTTANGNRQSAKVHPESDSELTEQLLLKFAGGKANEELIKAVLQQTMGNLALGCAPFLGAAASSIRFGEAAQGIATNLQSYWNFDKYINALRKGTTEAAANAIKELLTEALKKNSGDLIQHGSMSGLKIAGTLIDLGLVSTPALGVIDEIISIFRSLLDLRRDIEQVEAGNALLRHPAALTCEVFRTCPVLGCYLLTIGSTSDVLPIDIGRRPTHGTDWRIEVEARKKTIEPLLKMARDFIATSRIQLTPLSQCNSTHANNSFYSEIKADMVLDMLDNT